MTSVSVRFLPFDEWVWPSRVIEGTQGYRAPQPRRGTALRLVLALLIALLIAAGGL